MSSVTYRSCTGTKQPEFALETDNSFGFTLFPNPNNGQMQVSYELQDNQQGEIIIFAPDGKLIMSQQINQGIHNDFIDISHVNSGIYIYVVRVNDEIEKTGRISVMH